MKPKKVSKNNQAIHQLVRHSTKKIGVRFLSSKLHPPLTTLAVKLPLLAGIVFILGLVVFGSYQFFQILSSPRANHFPLPFSDIGNADWCSSSLQANLNSALFTDKLGSGLDLLAIQDCGDKISLVSQSDWLAYGSTYQASLGTMDYLPTGVTNIWTSTSVGDPLGEQAYQIDQAGSVIPAVSTDLADLIPTVKLASLTGCVTGTGASGDPYVVVTDELCDPSPPPSTPIPTPIPTSSPTPTPTGSPTPTPTPSASTTTCGSGYYLSDGSCQPNCNLIACTGCSSPNYCSDCEEGYTLTSGRCVPICGINNCNTCSTPNYCSVCAADYTNISGACWLTANLIPASTLVPASVVSPTPTPTPTPVPPTPPVVVVATNFDDANYRLQEDENLLFAHLGNGSFVPDLYSLAQLMGVSEATLRSIASTASYLILPIMLFFGLPLALLLAFFPLPRGKAEPGTIITVSQNDYYVTSRFTNESGNYWGFHLPEAQYLLQASDKGAGYPPATTLTNSSYHHNLYPNFTPADPDQPIASSSVFKLFNNLANGAPIIFAITLFLGLTYLTALAVIAIALHLGWMIRRVMLASDFKKSLSKTTKKL